MDPSFIKLGKFEKPYLMRVRGNPRVYVMFIIGTFLRVIWAAFKATFDLGRFEKKNFRFREKFLNNENGWISRKK